MHSKVLPFLKGDYDKTSSVVIMLNDLGLDTHKQRRQQGKATMYHCPVHGFVAVLTKHFLVSAAVSATRGPNMRYLIPQSSANAHLYSFFPSTMMIWNQLPQQVV